MQDGACAAPAAVRTPPRRRAALHRQGRRRLRGCTGGERVLATIVFSDICDSTATLERIGDKEWTRIVREHNERIRTVIDRFRGREMATLGDGFLALFDGAGKAVSAAAT